MLMLIALLRKMSEVRHGHAVLEYSPEEYGGASGELLFLAMCIAWVLTWLYSPELIEWNPLKARVGYNNLCVGWDEPPARYAAAPIFVIIIWLNSRSMQLDFWRMALTPNVSQREWMLVCVANMMHASSWVACILIFVISPLRSPAGHTASFVQLAVTGYFAYLANFFEVDAALHPAGSWAFLAFFGFCSIGFGICACVQFAFFDEMTGERGPIPWYVTAGFDYMWFVCLTLKGPFLPKAPTVICKFSLDNKGSAAVPTTAP